MTEQNKRQGFASLTAIENRLLTAEQKKQLLAHDRDRGHSNNRWRQRVVPVGGPADLERREADLIARTAGERTNWQNRLESPLRLIDPQVCLMDLVASDPTRRETTDDKHRLKRVPIAGLVVSTHTETIDGKPVTVRRLRDQGRTATRYRLLTPESSRKHKVEYVGDEISR